MSAIKGLVIAFPIMLGLEVAVGYGVSAAFSAPAPAAVRYEVLTYDGNLYVIGEGDTCPEAWLNHGPIPDDWRTIECRPNPARS